MQPEYAKAMKDLKGSPIREILKLCNDPDIVPLGGGSPAPELFPYEQLAEIAKKALLETPKLALQYGPTEGYQPLRDAVKKRLEESYGLNTDGQEVIISSGGQQSIDIAAKCFLEYGDEIIVEEPSFVGALNSFRAYGAVLRGVPLESDGADIEAIENILKKTNKVKLIYIIPNFQNPTGVTTSVEKRIKICELAEKYGVMVIEDDPYGELVFDGKKLPAIKSFDKSGNVIFCSSFSKILAPGLRLGFALAPADVLKKMAIAKQTEDVHAAMIAQLMAYGFINECDINALIEKMRALYRRKCGVLTSSLDEYFGDEITRTSPRGGLFAWCDFGHGINTFELAKKAIEKKVAFVPGNSFYVDISVPRSTLRLNFSSATDERIELGIKRLYDVFKEEITR